MRKIIIIICATMLLSCFAILYYMTDDKDYCLDTSICKEGLEINTEYGLIKVNKENCLKYNWIWNDKAKTCNMKD